MNDETCEQLRAHELSIGEIAFNAWQKEEGKSPRERWDAAAKAAINAHCADPARVVDELVARFPLVVVAKHVNAALPGLINFAASLSTVDTRADSGEAVACRLFDGEGGYHYTDDEETMDRWSKDKDGWGDLLFTHPRATAVDVFAIARAFTAGFKEACEWPEPIVQDIDSPAFGSAQRLYVEAAIASREGEGK